MVLWKVNYKKELGIALQEIKASAWFAELHKDDQGYVLDETKKLYNPPNDIENCMLNITIEVGGFIKEYKKFTEDELPYMSNNLFSNTAQDRFLKRALVSDLICSGKLTINKPKED